MHVVLFSHFLLVSLYRTNCYINKINGKVNGETWSLDDGSRISMQKIKFRLIFLLKKQKLMIFDVVNYNK